MAQTSISPRRWPPNCALPPNGCCVTSEYRCRPRSRRRQPGRGEWWRSSRLASQGRRRARGRRGSRPARRNPRAIRRTGGRSWTSPRRGAPWGEPSPAPVLPGGTHAAIMPRVRWPWLGPPGRWLRCASAHGPGSRQGSWLRIGHHSRVKHPDHVALIRPGVEGAGPRWLELGAGDGEFTLALADLLRAGEITAVDRDRWALPELERRVLDAFPATTLRTVVADFTETLPEGLYDGILAANSLHFVEAVAPVLEALARAPGRGGPPRRRGVRRGPRQPLGAVPHLVRAAGPRLPRMPGSRRRGSSTGCRAGSSAASTVRSPGTADRRRPLEPRRSESPVYRRTTNASTSTRGRPLVPTTTTLTVFVTVDDQDLCHTTAPYFVDPLRSTVFWKTPFT